MFESTSFSKNVILIYLFIFLFDIYSQKGSTISKLFEFSLGHSHDNKKIKSLFLQPYLEKKLVLLTGKM